MSSTHKVSASPRDGQESPARVDWSDPLTIRTLCSPVRRAIGRTRQWLLAQQHPEGWWCAELEGDTILESETLLLWAFLEREHTPLARRCAARLVEKQLPEGGWAKYPGGEVDISASVKAYFALKLTGHDPSAEYMQRARDVILAHGGADVVNSYTRYYLAMLGQISYEHCPAVPPEMVLLPKWFPVNLYAVSAWSRTIIVPLSIVSAFRPVRPIEPQRGVRELFLREPDDWPPLRCPGLPGGQGLLSWDRFFRTMDRLAKWAQRHGVTPWRQRAIETARRWMLRRFEGSDGLGAIYPPIVWSIVALRCLGYEDDSPELKYCYEQLEGLVIDDEQSGSARLQPCKSPVWDTAISLRALSASGVPADREEICRAVRWLLDRQVTRPGDWAETVSAAPGGWYFEFANDFYPDLDDTAMVLLALKEQFGRQCEDAQGLPAELRLVADSGPGDAAEEETVVDTLARLPESIARARRWILAMQNDDGGWSAFDRNNNRRFLCYVPFADHNAMIDPSSPDLTGRVLEALGRLGARVGQRPVDRAVAYLRRTQEPDGSWFGRWGVNYIYGTWQALSGLVAVGVPRSDPSVVAGAQWLLAHQQACGGWGESADTYEKPHLRGQGPPTASQTAWALLGLLAAGYERHPAVTRGVRYLLLTQQDDGTWQEEEFTGTGFPRVFYLRYHYYRIYFPLLALARWASAVQPVLAQSDAELRVVEEQ